MNKILVLDDEEDILAIVKIILEAKNFIVNTISKWEDILSSIKSFNPNLILLDIALAGADGRIICSELKSGKDTENIPIILFSANHGMEKTIDGTGANGFVAKPFEMSHLVNTINSALN